MSIILKIKSYHLNTILQPGPIPFCLTKAEWWLPLTWIPAVLGELEEDCAGLPAECGGTRDATLLFCVGHSQQCTQSRDAGDAGNSSSHLVPVMCDVKHLQWQRCVRLPHISDRTHVLLGSKQPQSPTQAWNDHSCELLRRASSGRQQAGFMTPYIPVCFK